MLTVNLLYLGAVSMGQNPRNLKYGWDGLCFAVGKRTAAINGKYVNTTLVSKYIFSD